MKQLFSIVRQVLFSVPLALAWIVCYALLIAGWGIVQGDKFIMYWNAMINDDSETVDDATTGG